MKYTFYKISHIDYPELLYIGSTKDFRKRKNRHKYDCYHENETNYNIELYQYIRDHNILFD
jgi:predicted GIY-YIG superfamily endonuclease